MRAFNEINELFEACDFPKRTIIQDFHLIRFSDLIPKVKMIMPPYYQNFFGIVLKKHVGDTKLSINSNHLQSSNNSLLFIAQGQVFSWNRKVDAKKNIEGYVVFFKKEFLSYYPLPINEVFPFFNILEINFLTIGQEELEELLIECEKMLSVLHNKDLYTKEILQSYLLAFLFKSKSIYQKYIINLQKQPKNMVFINRFC